jgi:ribonuclease HII
MARITRPARGTPASTPPAPKSKPAAPSSAPAAPKSKLVAPKSAARQSAAREEKAGAAVMAALAGGGKSPGGRRAAPASSATITLTIRQAPDFSREAALLARGFLPVAGVDEVGRGPLAGPVVAAAVILDPARIPDGLADSKQLLPQRREELYEAILATADVSVASVSAARIDEINILRASLEAMRRCLRGLVRPPGYVLVDGNLMPPWDGQGEAVVKGDALVASIAAASIVAKVTRDRMMARLGLHYPAYGFERHAGYATAAHRSALDEHGVCPFHRLTFASCAAVEVNEE